MTKARIPRRKRKGDRLPDPPTSEPDVSCDYAIGPLDRLALEMDRKWGIDRLPELVSPDTAERYGKAIAQLNAALEARDPKTASHKASVCMKGLRIMDAEAEANGAPQAKGNYWEYSLGDFQFAIIEDDREWQSLKAARPDLMFFTMREAALSLKKFCEVWPLLEVKAEFPGATITKLAGHSADEPIDDPLPF